MVKDIAHQRVDGFIIAEYGFHLPKGALAFLHDIRVGIVGHNIIFRIYELQRSLVQLQLYNTAFIIDGSGCAILDCLRHIINIYVITEHFTGAAVFGRDGRAGKSNVGSVRQTVSDDSCRTNYTLCDFFALIILRYFYLLSQTVLSTVGFVCHNHNVSSVRQRIV